MIRKEQSIMKELEIAASVDNLDAVLEFVTEELANTDCSAKKQMQIELAVEEVFVNIAHYAYYPGTGSATVRVEVQPEPPSITITFMDHGKPYNPLAREDPDVSQTAQSAKLGGLGIFLTKKSMDDVRYEYTDGSNILTMTKGLSL